MVLNQKNQFQNPFFEKIPKNTVVNFRLIKRLNSSEKNKRYLVDVTNNTKNFNLVLIIPKKSRNLDFTHNYSSSVYLIPLISKKKNLSVFDYGTYMARQNTFLMAFAKEENIKSTLKSYITLDDKIKQWRMNLLDKINATSLTHNTKEFIKSIILSDRTDIDKNIISQFNKTGLIHLLAISGSHIMVIFWVFQHLISYLFHKNNWKNISLSLAIIILFSVFIGFGNSVIRSCLMLLFYYTSILLKRQTNSLHSISLAAFTILIFDSNQVFDLGFQLSFLAVLGIYWLYSPIKQMLWKTNNNYIIFINKTFSLTLSAQLATFPLLIFLFGNISITSLLYNLIMVPITQIIIIFSFFECTLIGLGLNFRLLDIIYNYFSFNYLKSVELMSEYDPIYLQNIQFTILNTLFCYLIIFYLKYILLKFDQKNIIIFLVLILSSALFYLIERQYLLR